MPTDPSYLGEFDLQTERHRVTCATGDYEVGQWRGVLIETLLSRVEADDRSTHLLVTGEDGYRACIPLTEAIDALLAVAREDVEADGRLPRFVGDEIDGAESVASVERIETIHLDADEDASEYSGPPPTDR
ncbi:molybdopterin-dependent oxidoreductase [Natranaeroarchaeum sulfidigenes]|uniref:Periplasmic DMSO/TMAO reductase YedYZ, molybdopterin-dependent catalytic subunit n=1 Tax=Natranaeroarchaeum sulfidigenes TaxID=2784880 RepID=A0A897MSF2_9EURY|nr:molybdopterin-dependent oxidoreductase [Natranaeroarchaeum sulfidigenes]QSG03402.1 Periplasmic DMSO/TMAO reductase YedYZ, molybdopterin-dependent catalytic subunit [Natranaeroarchaeum sulfidigenes]